MHSPSTVEISDAEGEAIAVYVNERAIVQLQGMKTSVSNVQRVWSR